MTQYIDCPADHITLSDYGYWLMPVGRVLSLTDNANPHSIMLSYIKHTPDERMFDEAFVYERAKQPDISKNVVADFFAYNCLSWLKITLSVYSGEFSIYWNRRPTKPMLENLSYLLHEHDQYDGEIITNFGYVRGWEGLRKKIENLSYRP